MTAATSAVPVTVEQALDGLVDMHVHSGPSPFPRLFLHHQAARDAHERLNAKAIVVKSHHHNTVMDVLAQADALECLPTQVFGGIALNSTVGGLNPHAVRLCLALGGRVVWFPTISSGRHIECHPEDGRFPSSTVPLSLEKIEVRDPRGELVPEALAVIDVIAEFGAVLNGGHMYPEDIHAVFAEAKLRGVDKLVVSHPNFVIGADPTLCDSLVEMGAFIEHEVGMYNPDKESPMFGVDVLYDWIQRHGPEHIVLASDQGQRGNPPPVDAFLSTGRALLDLGLPAADLRTMTVDNPSHLLDLN